MVLGVPYMVLRIEMGQLHAGKTSTSTSVLLGLISVSSLLSLFGLNLNDYSEDYER